MKEEKPPEGDKDFRIQIEQITREKRQIEAEYRKETAVLKQKVELMKLELKEAAEREEDFRRMHETMMGALNSETPEKDQFKKELDFASSLHEREKNDMKKTYEEHKKIYDKQILEMREQITTQESTIKDLEFKKREVEIQAEANEANFRKEKGEMMEELNRLAEEREEIEDLARHNQAEVENNAMNEIEEL